MCVFCQINIGDGLLLAADEPFLVLCAECQKQSVVRQGINAYYTGIEIGYRTVYHQIALIDVVTCPYCLAANGAFRVPCRNQYIITPWYSFRFSPSCDGFQYKLTY